LPKQEGGLWIKYGDYPVAALQKGEGGVAGFTLSVDARGAVTKCALTSTSGSAALDKATCDLLLQRAAFSSALDGAGRPVTGSYSGAVRWVLPAPGRLARQGAFSYSYIVETDGTVSHCSLLQANGTMATRAQTYMGPCPLRVQEPYIDDRGNPVARKVTVINSVSIDPLP
jgi:protein TonB